jgi:hypothetical protein
MDTFRPPLPELVVQLMEWPAAEASAVLEVVVAEEVVAEAVAVAQAEATLAEASAEAKFLCLSTAMVQPVPASRREPAEPRITITRALTGTTTVASGPVRPPSIRAATTTTSTTSTILIRPLTWAIRLYSATPTQAVQVSPSFIYVVVVTRQIQKIQKFKKLKNSRG